MPMFRKKPVVIEAVQYNGELEREELARIWGFCPSAFVEGVAEFRALKIPTLEGEHIASLGDWIIKGVAGEFYPCKPEIFAATYEPAE